jgi:HSP20 family protein
MDSFDDDLWYNRPIRRDTSSSVRPYSQVKENENDYAIEVHVPGFSRDQVKVELRDGVLSVLAERENKSEKEGESKSEKVSEKVSYRRSWTVSKDLSQEDVNATFKEGLLSLKVNKKTEKEPERYSIQIN